MLELSLVMVAFGIIIGMGLPVARVHIENSKHVEDRNRIQEIREVLIGYAMSRAGFPDPDVGDLLPSASLGITGKNPYTNDIKYYANNLLTETATAQDFTTLCDTAKNILDGTTASTEPAICNSVTSAYVDCTDSTVMAFVIVSPGKNRVVDHENDDADQDYENPTKKPNSPNDYDDVVASYGLPALVNECQSI